MPSVSQIAYPTDRSGLQSTIPTVDLAGVDAHIQETIERIYQSERSEALRAEGIASFVGGARLIGPDADLTVDHPLQGSRLLICTGTHPFTHP